MQLSNPVGWENSSAALPAYKTSKATLNMRKLAATPPVLYTPRLCLLLLGLHCDASTTAMFAQLRMRVACACVHVCIAVPLSLCLYVHKSDSHS